MQTEYAIAGVSDKQRMISVFEIGVFCDRTVLADTCYLQKTMLNHNSRITESFLQVSVITITHLFANFNPVVQNNRNILTHLDFVHCRNIRGFFCNLTPDFKKFSKKQDLRPRTEDSRFKTQDTRGKIKEERAAEPGTEVKTRGLGSWPVLRDIPVFPVFPVRSRSLPLSCHCLYGTPSVRARVIVFCGKKAGKLGRNRKNDLKNR